MKKSFILVSAILLFASFSFAQTPQTQDKNAKPAPKTESVKKGTKSCADKKDTKECAKTCTRAKDSKCCAHGPNAKKSENAEQKPEKK